MDRSSCDIAFTPAVKAVQERLGSRKGYEKFEKKGGFKVEVSSELAEFIALRDSFYFATADAEGQPYIQHRGGQEGFLKVLDERTLAFPDFSGNRQYITIGNLSENNKAHIFLMDYPNRKRVKLWGRAKVVEEDPLLIDLLTTSDYKGRPERAIVFHVEAWDTNCPQHIRKRFTEEEVARIIEPLQRRIQELEAAL